MSIDTARREIEAERVNPYVGPRSLGREDGIYGRNREIRDTGPVLAHRIVLLYSQSGAGKTSLIEAGLRPEFEERGIQVFPTIRVGYEAPQEVATNRYLFSTLASLEQELPPEEQLDPAELAATSLDEYVRRRDEQDPDSDPFLIFDQVRGAVHPRSDRLGRQTPVPRSDRPDAGKPRPLGAVRDAGRLHRPARPLSQSHPDATLHEIPPRAAEPLRGCRGNGSRPRVRALESTSAPPPPNI